ncbi:hypothetical protein Q5P01_018338 [Channa striata]|uniref:Uncharacterized protein n=1 Tax=Channa striata TaxID=64152 RepID=A0AA88S9P6_CHASR|nr:hypothetical protein Q5P01_018338 [Channa striata]
MSMQLPTPSPAYILTMAEQEGRRFPLSAPERSGAERSGAGEQPWQQADTQSQQPVTAHRNGDSTCRQTYVDRRRRHLGRFPPIGGEIHNSHQALQLQSAFSSELNSRLHLLHPSGFASSAQGVLSPRVNTLHSGIV